LFPGLFYPVTWIELPTPSLPEATPAIDRPAGSRLKWDNCLAAA